MKHNVRRLIACLLAAVLLFSITGCDQGNPPTLSTTPNQTDPAFSTQPMQESAPGTEPPAETTVPTEPPVVETTAPTEATAETTVPTEPPVETAPPTAPPVETAPPTEPPVETAPPTEPPVETAPPTAPPVETAPPTEPPVETTAPPETTPVSSSEALANEAVQLPGSEAAIPNVTTAVASGTKVKSNEEAAIDYSNTKDGYVMVCYTSTTSQRLKVQVKGPATTYTYNLSPQQWTAFPLSDENGDYQITVYKNVVDSKYAAVLSLSISVTMTDEFAPYLCSNQFVNFDAAPATVAKAASLTQGVSDPLGKVSAVYNFVVYGMTYDTELAATVTSGYVPNLDSVLSKMTGICFDYAALMTGMLRSQGVPTKLVVGYAGEAYHAWINVWSESTGWVDGAIYFDGTSWKRMDPTFASSGTSSEFIGNGSNYSAKYFY